MEPALKQRNANLSDAVRQAQGDNVSIPRAEYTPPAAGPSDAIHYDMQVSAHASFAADGMSSTTERGGVGVDYSHVEYTSGPIANGSFYSLYYEGYSDESDLTGGVRFIVGSYQLPVNGIAGDSFSKINSFSIDYFAKYYMGDYSFVSSPYFLVSLGYGDLYWDYRQPIVDASGYSFSSDALEYVETKFGIGGELGRHGAMQLSVYAGPVLRIYMGTTREGFNNDLFTDQLNLMWGGAIGLRF